MTEEQEIKKRVEFDVGESFCVLCIGCGCALVFLSFLAIAATMTVLFHGDPDLADAIRLYMLKVAGQ